MLEELRAALERAAGLNAQAISMAEAQPPSAGQAVLASALRENRGALVDAVAAVLGTVWDLAFDSGRAYERGLSPAAGNPPERHLKAV